MAFFSCKKENSVTIPLNDYAKSWVPGNQDSIVYTNTGGDTLYLSFNSYSSRFQEGNNSAFIELVSQNGFTSDSGFSINYLLTSGLPSSDSLGKPTKIDVLEIASLNTSGTINISNTVITSNLGFIDSLYLPDSSLFLNVFTNGTSYYLNQQQKIVQLKSGNDWYFKN